MNNTNPLDRTGRFLWRAASKAALDLGLVTPAEYDDALECLREDRAPALRAEVMQRGRSVQPHHSEQDYISATWRANLHRYAKPTWRAQVRSSGSDSETREWRLSFMIPQLGAGLGPESDNAKFSFLRQYRFRSPLVPSSEAPVALAARARKEEKEARAKARATAREAGMERYGNESDDSEYAEEFIKREDCDIKIEDDGEDVEIVEAGAVGAAAGGEEQARRRNDDGEV